MARFLDIFKIDSLRGCFGLLFEQDTQSIISLFHSIFEISCDFFPSYGVCIV